MKIAFGSDHAGYTIKQILISFIEEKGHEAIDVGAHSSESSDYPDYADKAASMILEGKVDQAILICGSGTGMSIVANKIPGIRCASCTDPYCAEMARRHNHANILSLRARNMDVNENLKIIDAWLTADTDSDERHTRRIEKIKAIERKYKT